jgi:hypothetical protein
MLEPRIDLAKNSVLKRMWPSPVLKARALSDHQAPYRIQIRGSVPRGESVVSGGVSNGHRQGPEYFARTSERMHA